MSKHFIENVKKAKWHLAFIFGYLFYSYKYTSDAILKEYFFGKDGNGGDMLNIYTYLTDQEIAYLKFIRRHTYHGIKMAPDAYKNAILPITDQELADRGINIPREPYIEYLKRPPHDFYL